MYIYRYIYILFVGKIIEDIQLLPCYLHFALLLWHPNHEKKQANGGP